MRKIKIDREELIDLYLCKKFTVKQIGKVFGCTGVTIARKLLLAGINSRKRTFNVNEKFFSTWSPEMAYILGYITADGHVRNERNTLSFKSVDYELLEYVRDTIGSNTIIKTAKNSHIYLLNICSKKIVEDLNKLGLHNRKSLTIEFPKVPDELFWHYLRGEIDGDGHIFPNKMGLSIVGSKKFINTLIEMLRVKIGCTNYTPYKKGKALGVSIHGKHAYTVLKNVYHNEHYGLLRKKMAAIKAIKVFDTPTKCIVCSHPMFYVTKRRKYCSNKCKRKATV